MDWCVDTKALIALLGRTIYKPENVLVELCANSYDADASSVKITTSGESEQILIQDDGCGMNKEDLQELITLAKSRKKEMIANGQLTPKYNRHLLGSFGIGVVSFFSLGDSIKFFTRKEGNTPLFLEIKKTFAADGKLIDITISEPDEKEEYKQNLVNSEFGTTIEINNKKLDFKNNATLHNIVQHKLTNLPLSKEFRIIFNEHEIKKDDFNKINWAEYKFSFSLDNIDPTYKSDCIIYINTRGTTPEYKRGIYLVVNGRTIEKNLYSEIYSQLTSPGTINARMTGFIKADYLEKMIQANREDFFETEIINEIKNKIREPVQSIIDFLIELGQAEKEEESYTDLLQRVEKAKLKFSSPNEYLNKLGLNFKSPPQYEQELVLIIAQLCQIDKLPFQILDYSSKSSIDCVVKWPPTQIKRDPDFVAQLEVETTLGNFFLHNHDFRTKPDICCWAVNQADFEDKKKK